MKKLADRMRKDDEWAYSSLFSYNLKTDGWGLPSLNSEAYGKYIHSTFVKGVGTGKCRAVWTTELPEPGRYELFIHRPSCIPTQNKYEYLSDYPGMKNYYTVYAPEGKEEVVLEVGEDDPYWISLGVFDLPAGESRVELDDRGVLLIGDDDERMKIAQLVVADAVKWVKVK